MKMMIFYDINTDLLYIRHTDVGCLYHNEKRFTSASKKENTFIIEHSLVIHDPFPPLKNDMACTACQPQIKCKKHRLEQGFSKCTPLLIRTPLSVYPTSVYRFLHSSTSTPSISEMFLSDLNILPYPVNSSL